MEFLLLKEYTKGDRIKKFYKLGYYIICETNYGDDLPTVEITIEDKSKLFLPRIETIYDYNTEKIINFKINPSAYGSLSCEDIKIMIDNLNIALKTAEELMKKYVK